MFDRFCLISDDDGHWYIIPADKRDEADAYLESVRLYWGRHPLGADRHLPEEPDWLVRIDGPHRLTFTGYEVG